MKNSDSLNRRHFLGSTARGLSGIALASLLGKGGGRRTRRCDFRDPADDDFAVGERVFAEESRVCNDVFSRARAAALATVDI